MKIISFTDLNVWKKAHQLTLEIYQLSQNFPAAERFGITSQLRRCTSSVAANIVEGFYRNSTKELISFIYIARGSCGETIYFLYLSKDLKYISIEQYNHLKNEYEILIRQLNAWIKSLKK